MLALNIAFYIYLQTESNTYIKKIVCEINQSGLIFKSECLIKAQFISH